MRKRGEMGLTDERDHINEHVMKQTTLSYMCLNKVYTCPHCLICISGEIVYRKHVQDCSKYKCKTCKKTFLSDSTFKKHLRNCPPKRYPCEICQKDYSRKCHTDKHMKTHATVPKPFICHWCGCQCLTGKQLELHIEQKHSDF